MHEELAHAVAQFSAKGAAAVVLDAHSAEILAMVSLPAFDPNRPRRDDESDARFNRAAQGLYEMGSTFKAFTVAQALDSGKLNLSDGFDASSPLRLAGFTIRDYRGKNRWLSVPEILIHSSNIGAAKMALAFGADAQQAFLRRLGLLERPQLELPEVQSPLLPRRWRTVNVATVAFGHGMAVSPAQMTGAVAALVNGGTWRPPTLMARSETAPEPQRVMGAETSRQMRQLLRLVVTHGTGGKADADGYRVGGKTGTAEKITDGRYDSDRLVSSFIAAFPMDAPRFAILVVLDEPNGTAETHGYATGGWTAAPTVGRIVARIGPLAGIAPSFAPVEEAARGDGPGFHVSPDGKEIRLASR